MRTRMTTGAAALAVLLLGACGPEATSREELLAPAADMAMTAPSTATAVIEGREYTYGCPDFPCPVMEIVTRHIESGLFFWMTPEEGRPRIYLYVLRTPVLLRAVEKTDPIDPPVVEEPEAPCLTGPTELVGTYLAPVNQLVCRDFVLELVSDGGPWEFVRGEMRLDYMKRGEGGWIASGYTSLMPFGLEAWTDMLGGHYAIYPPFGSVPAYEVQFSALVRRIVEGQAFEYTVEHSLMCGGEQQEEPEPPAAPWLTGPEMVRGRRYPDLYPDLGIVCRDFTLALHSEDYGAWDYVDGEIVLEYLRWGHDLKMWLPTGERTVRPLGADLWYQLLHGTYALKPANPYAMAYRAVVHGTVSREYHEQEWTFPVEHTLLCVGPEYWAGIEKVR